MEHVVKFSNGARFIANESTLRSAILELLNGTETRDLDKFCGYEQALTAKHYQTAYERHDIAARVVNIYPNECWKLGLEVYETEDLKENTPFELAWKDLNERMQVISELWKLDKLSGIGRYGVMLMGIRDGKKLDQPVDGIDDSGNATKENNYQFTYLRVLPEAFMEVIEEETNSANPRFGQPKMYALKTETASGSITKVLNGEPIKVHWTRVLHFADNVISSMVYGEPRLKIAYNRLWDIRKVLGGNGEGMWKGGFPGISMETHPNIENPELNVEKTKEELQKYMEGQQRYLVSEGLTANALPSQVADPTASFKVHLEALCIAIETPVRVFMGTEEGRLASGQDMRGWNTRVTGRQSLIINPHIVHPFFRRAFAFGALPKPKQLIAAWPDPNAPTDADKASIAAKKVDAMVKYIMAGGSQLIDPKNFWVRIMGETPEAADEILAAVAKEIGTLPLASDILTPPEPPGSSKKEGKDAGAGRQ